MLRLVSPIILTFLLISSCSFAPSHQIDPEHVATTGTVLQATPPQASPSPEEYEYLGKSIDQVFPITESHDFQDSEYKGKKVQIPVAGYEVVISDFKPIRLLRKSQSVVDFQARHDGYWASLVGQSSLLGPESRQIYLVASGPGGVCCTNYWIVDLSPPKPRTIFRSEEFGDFRQSMEVFDADEDGIFELVQLDSCMRYFRDDCGTCSPEPRAYFKYDEKTKKYLPAKGVIQDFIKEQLAASESWLAEKYQEWKNTKDPTLQLDLNRSVIAHIADLLHLGEDRKAWNIFKMYGGVVDAADRTEIKNRLAQCKFYRALNHTKLSRTSDRN